MPSDDMYTCISCRKCIYTCLLHSGLHMLSSLSQLILAHASHQNWSSHT